MTTTAVCGHDTDGAIPLAYVGFSSPFGVVGDSTYTDVWGSGDLAVLGSMENGVGLIDISDPAAPQLSSIYKPNGPFSVSKVEVHEEVGFFATHDSGVHLVDIHDSASPSWLSTIDSANGGIDHVSGFQVYADDYLLLSSEDSHEISVFDISDRRQPRHVTNIATAETIGIYDLLVSGDHLFAAGLGGPSGEGATYVFDIGDVSSGTVSPLGSFATGRNSAHLAISANDLLTITQRRVGGDLEVWDVSDRAAPEFLARANASDYGLNAYSPGEVYVQDQIAYVAWHQEGVQSLDLDNIQSTGSISRLGFFDTSPATSPLSGFIGNVGVFVFPGHDRVLLSDSRWGLLIVNATKTLPVIGDFDGSGKLDVADLDALTEAVRSGLHDVAFDLTDDMLVTNADRERWIVELFGTNYGDSNLDRTFNSSDLIVVFQAGQYEDNVSLNSSWSTGDWNGDGDFNSGDIILAFQTGGYEKNATSVHVPEPTNPIVFSLFIIGQLVSHSWRTHQR